MTVVNFRILRAQLGKTLTGTQGENKQSDPIFLLQFLNVLYTADYCAKFEKNLGSTSFSRELPEKAALTAAQKGQSTTTSSLSLRRCAATLLT